jgi:hypothetical protein
MMTLIHFNFDVGRMRVRLLEEVLMQFPCLCQKSSVYITALRGMTLTRYDTFTPHLFPRRLLTDKNLATFPRDSRL